ncbi:MAG: zinc-ribbon domain-containing protein [Promethearchaeota archaeon]
MYCKNCGSELEIDNQRFCQNCGREIRSISYSSQLSPIRDPYKPLSTTPPQYQSISHTQIKKENYNPYSKRCLGFGIVCLVIGIISFNIGSSIVLDSSYYYTPSSRIFMGLTIAHAIGIIFAIFNRISYINAKKLEAESSILKAGNILGILGFIINTILIIIAISFI